MSLGFASQLDKFASRLDNFAKEKLEAVGAVPHENTSTVERASFLQKPFQNDSNEDAAVAAAREQLVRLAMQPSSPIVSTTANIKNVAPPQAKSPPQEIEENLSTAITKEGNNPEVNIRESNEEENKETHELEVQQVQELQRQVLEKSQRIEILQNELNAIVHHMQKVVSERDNIRQSSSKLQDVERTKLRRRAELAEAKLKVAMLNTSASQDLLLSQTAEKEARRAEIALQERLEKYETEANAMTEALRHDRDQARLELREVKIELQKMQLQQAEKQNQPVTIQQVKTSETPEIISSLVHKQKILDQANHEREVLTSQLAETKRQLRELKSAGAIDAKFLKNSTALPIYHHATNKSVKNGFVHLDRTFFHFIRTAPSLARRFFLTYIIALQMYVLLILFFSPHRCDGDHTSLGNIRRRR
uniref:Golgin-84 n=1 Tax=Aureoumbra lagunensis TaxID=44058 RepID=A0A6S8E3R6_9STRA|mmetsp:Transcript_4392/g.6666  ORF Transcript_4392/g.6666 Transcript_4392/m.6666 type:complete len:420 (+) Transcript_4392:64-1323(+)